MTHVRTPLPRQLRDQPFTVAHALELGLTPKRLRSSDLTIPFRGVRVSTALPWTLELRARCALLAAPEGSVVVGDDAVELHGLPTPFGARPALGSPVVVAVPAGAVRPRLTGMAVRAHLLHPEATVHRAGALRLASAEDLWAERCADLDTESAIALGDAVLRRLRGDRTSMLAAVERLPVVLQARARRALDLVRFEVCSPVETRARLLVRKAGIPEASHYSAPLPREGTAEVWPDLQWEEVRVGMEIDGPHHGKDPQHERDIRRRRRTERHGWTQVVFSSREVMQEPGMVVRSIRDELRRAGLRW